MASTTPSVAPVILVVEDNSFLRFYAADILLDIGFEVIEACNADEAIEVLESRFDIRLVFTDIHMPGSMDGLKLAAVIRNRWPPVELIITSGKASPTSQELPERSIFFPKPYNESTLTHAVRNLLN